MEDKDGGPLKKKEDSKGISSICVGEGVLFVAISNDVFLFDLETYEKNDPYMLEGTAAVAAPYIISSMMVEEGHGYLYTCALREMGMLESVIRKWHIKEGRMEADMRVPFETVQSFRVFRQRLICSVQVPQKLRRGEKHKCKVTLKLPEPGQNECGCRNSKYRA